jgi:hypothetical protein
MISPRTPLRSRSREAPFWEYAADKNTDKSIKIRIHRASEQLFEMILESKQAEPFR